MGFEKPSIKLLTTGDGVYIHKVFYNRTDLIEELLTQYYIYIFMYYDLLYMDIVQAWPREKGGWIIYPSLKVLYIFIYIYFFRRKYYAIHIICAGVNVRPELCAIYFRQCRCLCKIQDSTISNERSSSCQYPK